MEICFILDDASESSLRHLTFSKDAAKDASEEILIDNLHFSILSCNEDKETLFRDFVNSTRYIFVYLRLEILKLYDSFSSIIY